MANVIPCAGTGQDGELKTGAALAYVVDDAHGVITDANTGLMWEKLSDDGGVHDKDNAYSWDLAFTSKLAALNAGSGFANHSDWRLPNSRELQTLVDYEIPQPGPTVAAAFNTRCTPGCSVMTCSCTSADGYWSSSTTAGDPSWAWAVFFNDGSVYSNWKPFSAFVRAVRGGR